MIGQDGEPLAKAPRKQKAPAKAPNLVRADGSVVWSRPISNEIDHEFQTMARTVAPIESRSETKVVLLLE